MSEREKLSGLAKFTVALLAVGFIFGIYVTVINTMEVHKKAEQTRAVIAEWTEKLDSQTDEAGVYVRHDGDDLPAKDAWGSNLKVIYHRGGLVEGVRVRSAGADRLFYTEDDLVGRAMGEYHKNK